MTIMYEVGLNDSPMSIARKLTGNPRQHVELLAANPHKPIVYVRGIPTFASLGVGERLNVPSGFVGAFEALEKLASKKEAETAALVADVTAKREAYRTGTPEYRAQIDEQWRTRRKSGPFEIFKAAGATIEDIGEAIVSVPVLGDLTRIIGDVYTA
ncbi:hypothetical protein LCGC14_3095350, partial [marine sediment metagenome]